MHLEIAQKRAFFPHQVRGKYADKMTIKYNKDGQAELMVMKRTVSAAGVENAFLDPFCSILKTIDQLAKTGSGQT